MTDEQAIEASEAASTDPEKLPDDLSSYLWDDPGPSPTFAAERERESEPGSPRAKKEAVSSIEDFYSLYPEMGKGEWKLRVIRTEPKAHHGQHIAGFICDLYERVSQQEFTERFGGGVYTLQLMRPTTTNEGSLHDYKSVRELKIRVAGEPHVRGEAPVLYEGNNKTTTQVEMTRLQIEERERNRLHEERRRAEQKAEAMQREMMPKFYETTKRVVDDLSGMKEAQLDFWKQEVERLRGELHTVRSESQKEIADRDAALRKAQEENLTLRQQARETDRNIESKLVQEVKAHYEARISETKETLNRQLEETRTRASEERTRINEEHAKKIQELTATSSLQNSDAQRRWESERNQLFQSMQAERDRMSKEALDRAQQWYAQRDAELKNMRETYENRISDLRLATDRELQSLRDATAREIESIRQSERAQSSIAKETAELRKEAIKAEEQRLRQELTDLRRENADLRDRLDQERAKQHKDLPTAIREAREMASHLGLVEASEVERPEPEQSTMSQFVGLARQAFDSAPQILDKIMAARKEQQDAILQSQAMQAQAMQAQAAQAQAMQQRQMRQLPAPGQPAAQSAPQRPQQRYAPPSRQPASATPNVPAGVPFGGQPFVGPANPVPFAPPPVVVQSPVQSSVAVAPIMAEASMAEEPAPLGLSLPAIASEPAPPAPTSQSDEGLTERDGNLIVQFFQKLEVAIENKVLSPETFAIGVIDEIGAEQTASLLKQFTPQDIVDTASQLFPDTRIATRDGQKFVNELWRVGGERVRAAGFAA